MVNGKDDEKRDESSGQSFLSEAGKDIKIMATAGETGSAVESPQVDTTLAPDTGRRLNSSEKFRFAIGFIMVSLLWAAPFTMGSGILLPQIFNSMHGVSAEAALGTMNSIGCVFALVANIVFGALSDMSHFRIGKRTPWIVLGGVIGAVGFFVVIQSHTLFAIIFGWCIVQVGINCLIAPAVAVLSDRIPESTRGTFSALYGASQIVGQQVGTFVGSFFMNKIQTGLMVGMVIFLFSGILTVLIWPREKSAVEAKSARTWGDVGRSFIPPTKNCRDFYLALLGRFTFVVGCFMISGYQLYILQKYCHLSDKVAASTLQVMAVITVITTILSAVVSGPLSDFLQKRKVIVAVSCVVIALGMVFPIFMPNATGMFMYAAFAGIGNGCYMSVDQALNVDVLPSAKEAGKDLGILNLANTIGQVIAPGCTTLVIGLFGGYRMVFPIAIICLLLGTFFIMMIRKVK